MFSIKCSISALHSASCTFVHADINKTGSCIPLKAQHESFDAYLGDNATRWHGARRVVLGFNHQDLQR